MMLEELLQSNGWIVYLDKEPVNFRQNSRCFPRFDMVTLVSIIGYCNEIDEMMVVYEYISGGDLEKRLHKIDGKSKRSPLSWVERLQICIGAARALDYLHTARAASIHILRRSTYDNGVLLLLSTLCRRFARSPPEIYLYTTDRLDSHRKEGKGWRGGMRVSEKDEKVRGRIEVLKEVRKKGVEERKKEKR
ncbi:putative serine/threonine/dual specificity protein kinase, catalytic domain-containing protein [Tanacetum coccineum]